MSYTNYLQLKTSSTGHVTRERDMNDEWSGEDTHTDWSVEGIELHEKNTFDAVPNYLNAKSGDSVWALYAVYSTGDSFSHDRDGRLEFINVFATSEDAEAAAKILKNASGEAVYPISNGSMIRFGYVPWSGYFESLSYIEAVQLKIDGGKKRWYRD